MKKMLIGATLLISIPSFASADQLFGEYPSKYYCIKKNRKVVKCNMPSVQQIGDEIASYSDAIPERVLALKSFQEQAQPYRNKLIKIANDWSDAIGDNAFSRFYIDYAKRLDKEVLETLPKGINVEKEIGENGQYINFLKKVEQSILAGINDIEFGNLVMPYSSLKYQSDFNNLMSKLEDRFTFSESLFIVDFRSLVPLSKSCLEPSGYGKFMNTKIEVNAFRAGGGYKSFHLIDDQAILKEILSSNNGKPINVICNKVKEPKDLGTLKISYDEETTSLQIPYAIRRGFSSIPSSFGFEFTKTIIYPRSGHFHDELKEVLSEATKNDI